MCDKALAFMKGSVDKKQPFFLYLPDLLVHSPFETVTELEVQFATK